MTVILARLAPPVNTPKRPQGGYPASGATSAQLSTDNAQQNQHFAVAVAAVCLIKLTKNCANF